MSPSFRWFKIISFFMSFVVCLLKLESAFWGSKVQNKVFNKKYFWSQEGGAIFSWRLICIDSNNGGIQDASYKKWHRQEVSLFGYHQWWQVSLTNKGQTTTLFMPLWRLNKKKWEDEFSKIFIFNIDILTVICFGFLKPMTNI